MTLDLPIKAARCWSIRLVDGGLLLTWEHAGKASETAAAAYVDKLGKS